MKISAKEEYACAAVLELALNYESDSPVRVQDIAERNDIPIKFLFQIMQILKRVDIVRSKRGMEGGYVLARHPGQITVGDIIRSVSGPFVQLSNDEKATQFQSIWSDLDRAIGGVLNGVTFEDLARRTRAKQRQVMYHI
jgi:Rrf2 family cysteine metabolism transcriptional repressor